MNLIDYEYVFILYFSLSVLLFFLFLCCFFFIDLFFTF